MSEYSFDCEKFLRFNEFEFLIETSAPRSANYFDLQRCSLNFDTGEFLFSFQNGKKENYLLPFIGDKSSLNKFWKFLEYIVSCDSKAIFPVLYKGYEVFIYVEPVLNKRIRVMVFDTYDAVKKEENNEIYKYTYTDSTVRDDVLIEKKKFIEQFYYLLKNIFDKENKIVDFEPPLMDYNFWIKESEIIKKYLKLK